MKIRNGFVSNSSSSSFVVNTAAMTIYEIVYDVVGAYDRLMNNYIDEDDDVIKLLPLLKKFYKNNQKDFESGNIGIRFKGQDDTLIRVIENKVYIESIRGITLELSTYINSRCIGEETPEELEDKEYLYYNLESGVISTITMYNKSFKCKKCKNTIGHVKGSDGSHLCCECFNKVITKDIKI